MKPQLGITALLLAIILLLCIGCAHTPSSPAASDPTPMPTLAMDVASLPASDQPIATPAPTVAADPIPRYGEAVSLVSDRSGFSGTLRYPLGGVAAVNQALSDWARDTFAHYEDRALSIKAGPDGMRAVLDVDCETRMVASRYICIKETGSFTATGGGFEPVLFTYNYDLVDSRPLSVSDIINLEQLDTVSKLLTEHLLLTDGSALGGKTQLTLAELTNFIIRADGVEWLFAGNEGIVSVVLDYATLMPSLTLVTEPVQSITPTPSDDAGKPNIEQIATSLFDGVQVRSQPDAGASELLGTLEAGAQVEVIRANAKRGWHEIWFLGRSGYVAAASILLSSDPKAYATGYVTSTYLHVRAEANVNSELLGTLQNGEPVRIVDPNPLKGWYKIWFENRFAYVSAQYIHMGSRPVGIVEVTPAPQPGEQTASPSILNSAKFNIIDVGACTANGVIIRSEPTVNSPAYGQLARDEQVYLLEPHNATGWDKIFVFTDAARGYVGYVSGAYIAMP